MRARQSVCSSWTNEITFTTAEQYAKPTALTASDIGTTSATISWTGKGDSYNVQYRTTAGSWQNIASVTETTATLSGLATNNSYEYRIQSVKDGNKSDWSDTGEFALLTLQDEADNSSLIYNNTGRLAHVTLSSRTLYKDGDWNSPQPWWRWRRL